MAAAWRLLLTLLTALGVLCAVGRSAAAAAAAAAAPTHRQHQHHHHHRQKQTSAMERLLGVFGLEHHYHHRRERHYSAPPQYMLDLYNSIADQRSGVTIHDNPYHADVVRSYPDSDSSQHHLHFYFNVLRLEEKEKLIEAEFHVFKLKPRSSKGKARTHLLEVRVYQVMNSSLQNQEEGNRLLDARRISTHATGWEVFHVRDAVASWLSNTSSNYGLIASLRTLSGDPADDSTLRVVKRRHPNGRQPILVLFTSDGRQKPPQLQQENVSDDHWNSVYHLDTNTKAMTPTNGKTPSVLRHRRSLESTSSSSLPLMTSTANTTTTNTSSSTTSSSSAATTTNNNNTSSTDECSRHELYVNFELIGWASWIISPAGYNAHYCSGTCSFPLGQNQRPTNHATVQSIVHELGLHVGISSPCCVPNKLLSINLLYYDDHGNVIFKRYDDMVASSCGCH